MDPKRRKEAEAFVQTQKNQLGLSETEADNLLARTMFEAEEDSDADSEPEETLIAGAPPPAAARARGSGGGGRQKRRAPSDPYLSESQTIKVRPTRVSRIRSLLYEHALPNEYIVQVGVDDAKPILGGRRLKLGRQFLKFPAAVQTVYFTSDNANRNYQGLRIDGYACWRIDPEKPEIAARSLDFSDRENPMGNTNRILRTICTEAIRHIIANLSIEDALTKKDEIGRNLKGQLERIERSWGITFDQVGIERVTILSGAVFEDLQQKTRDELRLGAAESRMDTDLKIEKKNAGQKKEMETLRYQTEKETKILKATTESEIHKVELGERSRREADDRQAEEAKRKAENEAAERAAEQAAERQKRQSERGAAVEAKKAADARKLAMDRAQAEAEMKIKSSEIDAGVARAEAESETARAEADHDRALKVGELAARRESAAFEREQELEAQRLASELQMAAERFTQSLKERRERDELDHAVESRRLERLETEEAIRNRIAGNRVAAELMARLPEIAEAIEVDRYTVFDTSGGSPLTHTVAQLLSLLENRMPGLSARNEPDGDAPAEEKA
jgi:hypothetical protein